MSAVPETIAAKTGWLWLKQGIGLFRQQPAALTTLLFANILFALLLHSIPLLGQFIAVVLIPPLSMAVMQACLLIENKQRVTLPVLATGFHKPLIFTLCKIGLAYLLVLGIISLPSQLMLSAAINSGTVKTIADLDGGTLMVMMVCGVLQIFAGVALLFAAPLAAWQQMPAGKALFYSFFAVWRSARVFVVMLLAWFGLTMVASIIPSILLGQSTFGFVVLAWIGFLFILFLQCAMFIAYRQIFGLPEMPAARQS
jgi:hypothetical protein